MAAPKLGKKQVILLMLSGLVLAVPVCGFFMLSSPLFNVPFSPVLLSRDGVLLDARTAADGQWRFACPQKVPEKYETALIAHEDRRFRFHPGVDPAALVRAVYAYIRTGRMTSGASTITMQLMRMSGDRADRDIKNKLSEMVRSIAFDLTHSKNTIISLYACHAPFGGNIVGMEAASRFYFRRPSDEMSWAEAALLAVLPKSPSMIHPGRRRDDLKTRRDRLLQKLESEGRIDPETLRLSMAEPLPGPPRFPVRYAPHLLDSLMAGMYGAEPRASDNLFRSTISSQEQQIVNKIVSRHAEELALRGIKSAAALVIDNSSGEVIVYIGNTGDYSNARDGGAVDIARARRSTGSILKPFLFAAMLQAGELIPEMLVPDIPTQIGGFMPENFDRLYRGAVPAKTALAASLNIPAVRLLADFGVQRFYDFLKSAGLETLDRNASDYGLSLIIGGAEGTLYGIAGMYSGMAMVVSEGDKDAYDPKPAVLLDRRPAAKAIIGAGPGALWITFEALIQVGRPELDGLWEQFASSRKVAWKTGTSHGFRDAWAIGITPEITVAIWAGNPDGRGVAGLTGISAAAPILFDVINAFQGGQWFERPWLDLKEIEVCMNDGYPAFGNCRTLMAEIPEGVSFNELSPYRRRVHLDMSGRWRVHEGCQSVHEMKHPDMFVLPPVMEYYYRKQHPEYRGLPKWRPDCLAGADAEGAKAMSLVYPGIGTKLYVPVELDGKKGRTVFEAVHRDPEAKIWWYIDENYMGETSRTHKLALEADPGRHILTLTDNAGNRLTRSFEVLR